MGELEKKLSGDWKIPQDITRLGTCQHGNLKVGKTVIRHLPERRAGRGEGGGELLKALRAAAGLKNRSRRSGASPCNNKWSSARMGPPETNQNDFRIYHIKYIVQEDELWDQLTCSTELQFTT